MEVDENIFNKKAWKALLGSKVSTHEQAAAQEEWDPTGEHRLPPLTTLEAMQMLLAGSQADFAFLESMIEASETKGFDQSASRSAIAATRSRLRKKTLGIPPERIFQPKVSVPGPSVMTTTTERRAINDLSPQLSTRRYKTVLHTKPAGKELPEVHDLTLNSLPKEANSTMSNKLSATPPQTRLRELKTFKSAPTPACATKSELQFSMPYPESWEPKKGNELPGYVMRIRNGPDERATEKAHASQSFQHTKSATANGHGPCQPVKQTTEYTRKSTEQEKTQATLPSTLKRIIQVRVDEKAQCPITTTNRASTDHYRNEEVDKQLIELAGPPKPLVQSKHIASAPNHQKQESEGLIENQAQHFSETQSIEPTGNERLNASKKRKDISPSLPLMESKRLELSLMYRRQTSAERAEKGNPESSELQIQLPKTRDAYFHGNRQVRERTSNEGYRGDNYDNASLSYGIHRDRQRLDNAENNTLRSKVNTQSYAARHNIEILATAIDSGRGHSASSFQSEVRNSVESTNRDIRHDTQQNTRTSSVTDQGSPLAGDRKDRSGTGGGRGQYLQSSQDTTPSTTSHTKYSVSATSVDTSPHNECMHPMRRQYIAQHHAEKNCKSPPNPYTDRRLHQYTLLRNESSTISVTTTTGSTQDNVFTSKPRSLCSHSAGRDSVCLTNLPRAGRAQDVPRDKSSTGKGQLDSGVREFVPEYLQRKLGKEASVSGASDGEKDYTSPNKQGQRQAGHPQFSAPEPRSDTRTSKTATSRAPCGFDSAASSSLAKPHTSPSTNQNTPTKSSIPSLKCRHCNTHFLTQYAFNKHIHGTCSRTCQYCNRILHGRESFSTHNEYECPQTCSKCHEVMKGFKGMQTHVNDNKKCREHKVRSRKDGVDGKEYTGLETRFQVARLGQYLVKPGVNQSNRVT